MFSIWSFHISNGWKLGQEWQRNTAEYLEYEEEVSYQYFREKMCFSWVKNSRYTLFQNQCSPDGLEIIGGDLPL